MAFNPHQWYLNGTRIFTPNTFIGGVSSTINTPALLANKLNILDSDINNFTIDGDNISCFIAKEYEFVASAFISDTSITYYYDYDSLCKLIPITTFRNCINLLDVSFNGVLEVRESAFRFTRLSNITNFNSMTSALNLAFGDISTLITVNLPNMTSYTGSGGFSDSNLETCSIPLCTVLGNTVGNDTMFSGIDLTKLTITANNFLQTNNSGSPDGDLAFVTSGGGTVIYTP